MSWGGAEEQNIERMGGNPDAKNWQDEVLKMVEKVVSVAFLPRFPSIIEQQIDEYVLQIVMCRARLKAVKPGLPAPHA